MTTDIRASLARARELCGKELMPRTELAGGAGPSRFADSEGNAIGLVEEQV